MNKKLLLLIITSIFFSCKSIKLENSGVSRIKKLKFIGEQIIPEKQYIDNSLIGGFSSIDYANGKYYVISDSRKKPIHFYEMELNYDKNYFAKARVTKQINIKINDKIIDPESLRFDKKTNHFFWTSEGETRDKVAPAIFEMTKNGDFINKISAGKQFEVNDNKGPRRNGTFECLTMDKNPDFIWVGMELPLKEDGEEPSLKNGDYPVRISKINKKTGEIVFQFAYNLDKIPKDSKPSGRFTVNGMPEILYTSKNSFLTIERAYASGHGNGGNTIKIFEINIQKATDIKDVLSLKNANYTTANKKLLFDFETIRNKLTNNIVDNIEGITFGKTLKNGHKTIVVISDDNFKKFGPQLNQIIVLEVIPK